ncbi:MAG: acyltransferase family protein [Pseudomonadota bacterium]
MKYRAEIDGLRAIAIIPVILFHADFDFFSGGYVGVDVFFVISGYLITTIIINELEANNFSLVNFYERRARRILPAMSLVVLTTIPFACYLLDPTQLLNYGKSLVGVGTFTSNIFLMLDGGYFADWVEIQPLLHTWSLSVEEQFYVFFPLLMLVVWRWKILGVYVLVGLTITISFVLALWGDSKYPNMTFYVLPTRAWELATGSFVALLSFKKVNLENKYSGLLSGVGLLAVVIPFVRYNNSILMPNLYALIPTLGTALVILFANQKNFVGKFLSIKPIVFIGLLSYSAYLWHQPIIAFTKIYSPVESYIHLKWMLVITIFPIAFLSWSLVEKPFKNKHRFERKFIFISSIFSLLLFVLVGAIIWKFNGFIDHHPAYRHIKEQLFWSMDRIKTKECSNKYGGDQYCVIFDVKNPITDVLIGDSHANHFFPGLSEKLAVENRNLLMMGAGGCPPFINIDREPDKINGTKFKCFNRMNELYKNLGVNKDINTIFLAFSVHSSFNTKLHPTTNNISLDFKNDQPISVFKALHKTIDYFVAHGKKVVLIEDLPGTNYPVFERCLFKKNSVDDCLSLWKLEDQDIRYKNLIKQLYGYEGLTIVKTEKILNHFPKLPDGSYLYRDDTHLTPEGSKKVFSTLKLKDLIPQKNY